MPAKFLKRMQFKLSRVGKRVEQTWDAEPCPTLACALEIRHGISCEREEVDLAISEGKARIHYRRYEGRNAIPVVTNHVCHPTPNDLEAELRSLGILELRSVSGNMFDGSRASIAARDSTHRHLFREHSTEGTQARLREFLLELGRPATDDNAPDACGCAGSR